MNQTLRVFTRGFFTQLQVVQALILRETRTSFGKYQLGYLWAFAEPLMWIGTFGLMFMVGKRNAPDGMDTVGFLSTGLLPYIMFRKIVSKTNNAISANSALLYYPQIRPLDLVAARSILECVTLTVVFTVLLLINTIYLQRLPLDNLFNVVAGLILVSLFAAGVGLTLSSLTSIFPTIDHFIVPILRPLLWISGVFFSAKELPPYIREILLVNPLLHLTELTRDGWFKSYSSPYVDINYVAYWILLFAFLGLTLERVNRRNLEA